MNCCKKYKGDKRGLFKLFGIMMGCCIIPIILLAITPMLGLNSFLGEALYFIAPLICPIIMGVMMLGLFKCSKSSCSKNNKVNSIR